MKKLSSLTALVVLLVLLLSSAPLQVFAASGPGYSITPSVTSLTHGASGSLAVTLTVPANTIGSVSIVNTSTSGLTFGGGPTGASVNVPILREQDFGMSFPTQYIMTNSAQESQQLNWSVDTVFNGNVNHYTGSFTIAVEHTYSEPSVISPLCEEQGYTIITCTICGSEIRSNYVPAIEHDWGAWFHDGATSGEASTHKRICANDANHTENNPCLFTPEVTAPTCTEAGYTRNTCSVCNYSYEGSPVAASGHDWRAWFHDGTTSGKASTHNRICANDANHIQNDPCLFTPEVTAPTCTEAGHTRNTCGVCKYSYNSALTAALGHNPGEWEIITSATGYKEGEQARYCTRCGIELDREAITKLNGMRYSNTACTLGQRFRDVNPALTDKWHMLTPVDLSAEGVQSFPLIAANMHYIGDVQVTVQGGSVQVGYTLNSDIITVKEEYLTFFTGLGAVTTVLPEEMPGHGVPLRADIPVVDVLGESAKGLLYLRLVVNYDIYASGIQSYREGMFD